MYIQMQKHIWHDKFYIQMKRRTWHDKFYIQILYPNFNMMTMMTFDLPEFDVGG